MKQGAEIRVSRVNWNGSKVHEFYFELNLDHPKSLLLLHLMMIITMITHSTVVMCIIDAWKGTTHGTADLWPSFVHLGCRLIIASENAEDNEHWIKLFSQPDINCKVSQLNSNKHIAWAIPFSFLSDYDIQLEIFTVPLSMWMGAGVQTCHFKSRWVGQQPVTDNW